MGYQPAVLGGFRGHFLSRFLIHECSVRVARETRRCWMAVYMLYMCSCWVHLYLQKTKQNTTVASMFNNQIASLRTSDKTCCWTRPKIFLVSHSAFHHGQLDASENPLAGLKGNSQLQLLMIPANWHSVTNYLWTWRSHLPIKIDLNSVTGSDPFLKPSPIICQPISFDDPPSSSISYFYIMNNFINLCFICLVFDDSFYSFLKVILSSEINFSNKCKHFNT